MRARQKLNEVCDEINEIQVLLVDVISHLNTVYITLGLTTRAELRFVPLASRSTRVENDPK